MKKLKKHAPDPQQQQQQMIREITNSILVSVVGGGKIQARCRCSLSESSSE